MGRELGTNSNTLYTVSLFNDYTNRNESTTGNQLKRLYLSINPNYSVLNVKTPHCYFRKFSPDGKHLFAFNQALNGVQVFLFNGSSSGIGELKKINTKIANSKLNQTAKNEYKEVSYDKTNFNESESDQFRTRAFDVYFKELYNLKLVSDESELMNRECSLFYNNNYLIVASSEIVTEENTPSHHKLATNNESIFYSTSENYTIYLVDLKSGRLNDKIKFNADKLNLTHNQSLCLFKNVFAVLSQQNQTIHVYKLIKTSLRIKNEQNHDGLKFIYVQQIGRFCFQDDSDFISQSMEASQNSQLKVYGSNEATNSRRSSGAKYTRSNFFKEETVKPFSETCFTGMKQRLISFFYKESVESNTISQFYANLNSLANLKMYRMQLLDDRHIWIKYVDSDQLTNQKSTITITTNAGNASASSATAASSISTILNQHTNPISSYSLLSQTSASSNVNAVPGFQVNNDAAAAASSSSASTQPAQSPTPVVNSLNPGFNNIILNAGITTTLPVILNENAILFYFVLYDMKDARILSVLKNNSPELLNIYETLQDYLTLGNLDGYYVDPKIDSVGSSYGSSFSFHTVASNNIYARQTLQRHMKNISKFNSKAEMTKCLLSQLPISSQSYTLTPYLDHDLFSYDEKLISNLERPKPINDQIIKFSSRETGEFFFILFIKNCLGI